MRCKGSTEVDVLDCIHQASSPEYSVVISLDLPASRSFVYTDLCTLYKSAIGKLAALPVIYLNICNSIGRPAASTATVQHRQ